MQSIAIHRTFSSFSASWIVRCFQEWRKLNCFCVRLEIAIMQALSGSDWSLSNPLTHGSSFRHPFNPGMFPWPLWSAFTASDVGYSSMWRFFALICHSRMASLCVESFLAIMVNWLICLPFLWSNVNLLIWSSVTPASFAIHWMIASRCCCCVRMSLVSEYFQKFLTRIFVTLSARCFSTFV